MLTSIKVYLDENIPEYMSGIVRCSSVISEDENGQIIKDHQELIDNTEYHSEEELIEDIARRLNVDKEIIEVVDNHFSPGSRRRGSVQ